MDEQTDRRMDERTDTWMQTWNAGWMHAQTGKQAGSVSAQPRPRPGTWPRCCTSISLSTVHLPIWASCTQSFPPNWPHTGARHAQGAATTHTSQSLPLGPNTRNSPSAHARAVRRAGLHGGVGHGHVSTLPRFHTHTPAHPAAARRLRGQTPPAARTSSARPNASCSAVWTTATCPHCPASTLTHTCTPCRSTSSARPNASCSAVRDVATSSRRSFGMTMTESTLSRSDSMPTAACSGAVGRRRRGGGGWSGRQLSSACVREPL
eukprot:366111-Chlamydomonas_euryale.AAC.13